MVASANWVPSSLGGRGLVPLCCGDHDETNVGDEETLLLSKNALNHHHHNDDHHHHQAVPPFAGDLLHIDVDDSDEEMEPFDAERFVDRLVEDDPSPWRCDGVGQGQAHLWEAPGADAGTGMMMTGPSSRSTSAAAKLFLQPIHSWPLAPQPQLPLPLPQLPQPLPQPPLDAPARSVFEEGSRGVPFVVPHDPILDALFTPARATSPEIVPTVTYGLVGVGAAPQQQQQHEQQLGGGSSNIRNGGVVPRFEPAAIYNIPAPVDVFPAAVRVPTAPLPLKPSFGVGGNGRGGGGGFCLLASPSGAKIIFGSEEGFPRHQQQQQQQLIQQQQQEQELLQQQQLVQQQQLIQQEQQEQEQRQPFPFATINTVLQQQQQQKEIPGKVFGGADAFSTTTSTAVASVATISSATATIAAATRAAATSAVAIAGVSAPAPPQLTGADGFSDEYNDQQHAFLRRQEVALFVGPGYLAGPGRPGLVTPAERTSIVAWLCEVHAAAPAASCGEVVGGGGGGGSPPLSRESLFLAVNLLDRFLSTAEGARTSFAGAAALRVAAAASLALASKYEDTQAASLWGVAAASALANSTSCYCCSGGGESCDSFCSGGGGGGCVGGLGGGGVGGGDGDVRAARKELAAMELRVASALGFRLTVPTALSFLGVFMRRADALGYLASGAGSERVREEAQQILLCVLRDACSLEHPPSALAAAALYWASCVTAPGAAAPASFSFFAVTGYQLERLCHCLRDMEGVRTGGGRRHGGLSAGGGGVGGGGDWAGAAFPEHAERSLFDAGGGHPAIAAL